MCVVHSHHINFMFWLINVFLCLCARATFDCNQCSAECGQGNRTRVAICLTNHMTHLPLDSCEGERPPEVTLCDSGPCQNRLEWYTGPWGQVTFMHAPCEVLYVHAAPVGVSLCSVLCRVWEWHTDQEPGLYLQYQWTCGGCGWVKMFQHHSADGSAVVHAETLWCAVVFHRLECSKCQCIPLWLIISDNDPDRKAQMSQWCHLDVVSIKWIVRWLKHEKNPNVFYTCCMIF